MIRSVLGSRASIGGVLGSGRGGAAAWYLAGGVSAANCVAAYQPIGAVSLAASYTNLANPGTYDAAPGVAPTWSAATGWTFNGSTQHLSSQYTPGTSQITAIMRFSLTLTTDTGPFGYYQSGNAFYLKPISATTKREYASGSGALVVTGGATTNGVMAIANKMAYYNGALDGTISGGVTTISYPLYIGAVSGPVIYYQHGKIQALAIYNVTLTAPQVAAISSAMSALA